MPVADESVSRVHAEIWLNEDGSLMLADRGSSNGTTLIRAGQAFPLTNAVVMAADQVRFGNATLLVAELISAVESRNPGALTPMTARQASLPPLPPPPPQFSAPPPPAPPRAGGMLVRCYCGAVKTYGQPCPNGHP